MDGDYHSQRNQPQISARLTQIRIALVSDDPVTVRHERERSKDRVARNYLTDEGRPLETGLQGQVSNHLRRLGSKALVVSAEGKGLTEIRSGEGQEEDRKETTVEVSKDQIRLPKPRHGHYCGTELRRNLLTGGVASGMRGGLSLSKRRLGGTWEPETSMKTEKPQVEEPRGREYGGEDSGAGQRVVAEKSPRKGWSEGAVSRSRIQ